ncbi:MFS transporter [Amnibacterium endophyticum]|uniref:MFS transporter n=1 Tax=Amnibacterium endophyticum TaxID=2109337 RepID=A0ABW4LDV9_9MICO
MRRLPPVVFVLAAGTFLMLTSEFVVAGLLPAMARDLGNGIPQVGTAITVFAVGMIASPATVLLTLRLPRRSTLALLLAVFAAGHVAAALSPALAPLLVARFVTALATGAFWALSGLVAADAAGEAASSSALGVIQGGGALATVLGVPVGAFAAQAGGWRDPFWALALLAALASLLVLRTVPGGHARHGAPTLRGELHALRRGRLWLVLGTCALVAAGVLSIYGFSAPLLVDCAGLPEALVPVALAVFGGAGLVGTLLAGRLGDRHPHAVVVGAAAITLAAAALLLPASSSPVPAVLVLGLLGLSGLSANPVLALLAIRAGGSAPTLASALTPAAFNTGTAVGTGIASAALAGSAGVLAPVQIGVVAAALVLGASIAIALVGPRARRAGGAVV